MQKPASYDEIGYFIKIYCKLSVNFAVEGTK
jgi:hypothetical protein